MEKKQLKYWSQEEKLRLVKMAYKIGMRETGRRENIPSAMISIWTKKYEKEGKESLKSKRGFRMPYKNKTRFSSKEEQLEYEIVRLKVENERLKKGYIVKGVGQKKEFISINKKNLK
jgi:transposase-like protein